MATKIRMQRAGRKDLPFWRIAVFDTRTRRDGRFIERLGFYDPMTKDEARRVVVDGERYQHWVSQGAQTSEALASLLKGVGIDVPVRNAGKRARRRRRRLKAKSSK